MRSKYILFALALTGALASCSDDDNNKKPVYNNPYSNPLTNYIIRSMYMLPTHL